jgi:hypothetical protein
MTQRVEAEGTSTWTYDTKSNGIGKLSVVKGPNGYKNLNPYCYQWCYQYNYALHNLQH